METIRIGHYNNYFNRTIKKGDSYSDYITDFLEFPNQNFNPGDGVTTTHVLGKYSSSGNWYNYLVVLDKPTTGVIIPGQEPQILSRWFIVKTTRLRGGQWELTLKRDSIVDNYYAVTQARGLIERAMVDSENPLIFNKENFTYNQIKKEEILLKDETKTPWIVAYIPTDAAGISDIPLAYDLDAVQVSTLPVAAGIYRLIKSQKYDIGWNNGLYGVYNKTTVFQGGYYENSAPGSSALSSLKTSTIQNANSVASRIASTINSYPMSSFNTDAQSYLARINNTIMTQAAYEDLSKYQGLTVYCTADSKYYQLTLTESGRQEASTKLNATSDTFYIAVNNLIGSSGIFDNSHKSIGTEAVTLNYSYSNLTVTWREVISTNTAKLEVSGTRKKNDSGLYDIIALPYDELDVYKSGSVDVTTNNFIQRAAGITLGLQYSSQIYDLQLLPYCPVRELLNSDGNIDITGKTAGTDFDYIMKGADKVGILFYVQNTNAEFNIPLELEPYSDTVFNVQNAWRRTSPSNIEQDTWYQLEGTYGEPYLRPDLTSGEVGIVTSQPDGILVKKINYATSEVESEFTASFVGYEVEAIRDVQEEWYNHDHIINLVITKTDNTTIYEDQQEYTSGNYRYVFKVLSSYSYVGDLDDGEFVKELLFNAADMNSESLIYNALEQPLDINIATKIDSECSFERLVSPNYQGAFEFCVAKNGGVNYFNVDMTLKPINPYIHVNPNFGKLYGTDFNDARGLICNGDFSFGLKEDKFIEYELQNRNYQSIFNRQIESMDAMHKIDKQEAIVNVIAGTMQGGATGAGLGAMAGLGMGLGAATAAISAGAGIADIANMEKRYAENKDLTMDMHEFQLDNIRALPYSLAKCPAFTSNNKLYPFIERYSATDEEIECLRQYIRLRSMNVGVMGTIGNYIKDEPTFIQAQILRLDSENPASPGLYGDSNVANDIYNELKQGVYM